MSNKHKDMSCNYREDIREINIPLFFPFFAPPDGVSDAALSLTRVLEMTEAAGGIFLEKKMRKTDLFRRKIVKQHGGDHSGHQ